MVFAQQQRGSSTHPRPRGGRCFRRRVHASRPHRDPGQGPGAFPEYTASLQAAMIRDLRETWAVVAFDDKASALNLFSTTKVVVNLDLAKLYGIDTTGLTRRPSRFARYRRTAPASGILSKAGFLSQFANQKEGSPTLRGRFIREALMCSPISPRPGREHATRGSARRHAAAPSGSGWRFTGLRPPATVAMGRWTRSASPSRPSTPSAAIAPPITASRSTRAAIRRSADRRREGARRGRQRQRRGRSVSAAQVLLVRGGARRARRRRERAQHAWQVRSKHRASSCES